MDIRREIKIDPKVELKDYSGPFKPDLRFSDFSREQLARMYVMACEYFYDTLEAWAEHVAVKYGFDAMLKAQYDIWCKRMFTPSSQIKCKWMNIEPKDIESVMKDLQIDCTAAPPKFDVTFELPSKDRGILTFNRCPVVDQFEALGLPDQLRETCAALCPESIAENAKLHNPDIVTTCLAMPPRKSKDDICCKWEFTYKSK